VTWSFAKIIQGVPHKMCKTLGRYMMSNFEEKMLYQHMLNYQPLNCYELFNVLEPSSDSVAAETCVGLLDIFKK
jgi:hypothetical protein